MPKIEPSFKARFRHRHPLATGGCAQTPGRKVMQPDNRAAHFYIAMWWAEAMGAHDASFRALAAAHLAASGSQ